MDRTIYSNRVEFSIDVKQQKSLVYISNNKDFMSRFNNREVAQKTFDASTVAVPLFINHISIL